jgi:hypothetical protein
MSERAAPSVVSAETERIPRTSMTAARKPAGAGAA